MKRSLTAAVALLSLVPLPAQRVTVSFSVDVQARQTTFTYGLWGSAHAVPGYSGALIWAPYASTDGGLGGFAIGPWYLGSSQKDFVIVSVPLDAHAHGGYQVTFPAQSLGTMSRVVQGVFVNGVTMQMTDNYVLIGHWTNANASQILAGSFNSEIGRFRFAGRYRSGVDLTVVVRNPGESAWRLAYRRPATLSPDVDVSLDLVGVLPGAEIEVRDGKATVLHLR